MADNKLYDILGVDRNASEAEIKKVIIISTVIDFFYSCWKLLLNIQRFHVQKQIVKLSRNVSIKSRLLYNWTESFKL